MSWETLFRGRFDQADLESWGALVDDLHEFHDVLASLPMAPETFDALRADLRRWTEELAPHVVDEGGQVNGRVRRLPSRGHAMLPRLVAHTLEDGRIEATVRFGRWFMGGGMAAHGGAITVAFDEVLGWTAGSTTGQPMRTAYLRTDYRALTPIDVDLQINAWVERVEGRKVFLRAEIRHGDTVCAEADALFLRLMPGQGLGKRA